jgi:GNAT superfamily N-acetyltransferase
MTDLEIRQVDPADADGFAAFHAVYAAAAVAGPAGEFATPFQIDELRVAMSDPDERRLRLGWAGLVGDATVVSASLEASTVDNTDLATVLVFCHPDHRGHGYAAALLAHVEDQARARGMTRLVAEMNWAYEAGPAGTGSTDLAWARRQGFEVGLVDVQRRLALPLADELLDRLAAEAAAHHQGYELRSFTGRIPDELAEGWVALDASLMTEAPMGDIAREEQRPDVGALRAQEAMIAAQGRDKVNTVALSPAGEVVAFTDFGVTVHESERAYQWGTLVRTDHRGHRLGLAVKVANLRLLQEAHPQITTVVTYNADVNAPMIAVNEQLGFRPVAYLGELQKQL